MRHDFEMEFDFILPISDKDSERNDARFTIALPEWMKIGLKALPKKDRNEKIRVLLKALIEANQSAD